MEYRNVFGIEWNIKNILLLSFLAIFPNVLGLFHTTVFGVRVHFFQYLIFLAALVYGPFGGVVSGAFGSIWTAVALNNPYILIGNVILGGLFGYFVKLKWNVILAAFAAYLVQMPWLYFTDVYFAGMASNAVIAIMIALFFSDILWAVVAKLTSKYVDLF